MNDEKAIKVAAVGKEAFTLLTHWFTPTTFRDASIAEDAGPSNGNWSIGHYFTHL